MLYFARQMFEVLQVTMSNMSSYRPSGSVIKGKLVQTQKVENRISSCPVHNCYIVG